MERSALHSFLLDFFPLTDEISEQNRTFADALQRVALDALLAQGPRLLRKLEEIGLLLALACDLGYIDAEVLSYLQRQLRSVMTALNEETL